MKRSIHHRPTSKPNPSPSLSPLARAVYQQLRRRLRTPTPAITYGELAAVLSSARPPVATHPRSSKLHAALGEVTAACRGADLPCLPAIVHRRDTNRPSDGYYRVAHPRARSERARVAAWQRERILVVASADRFPAVLP